MKFYHCFYTDLPDQFVEANSNRLIKWVDGWADKNRYYRRSMVIDTVSVDVIGNAKTDKWPKLKSASQRMTALWIKNKGAQYSGGYWEFLAEDQRSPHRISSDPWRDQGATFFSINSPGGAGTAAAIAPASRRMLGLHTRALFLGEQDVVRPPLRRDGIVAGEIVGYRCWRVEQGLLRSVYQPDVWMPGGILEGRELQDWNQRGIHVWKDSGSKDYHDYIRTYLNYPERDVFGVAFMFGSGMAREVNNDRRPAMVTGTAFLWGDVVEHERGYRAEFARVRSLDWLYPDASMMGREPFVLEELRNLYGVSEQSR